MRADDAPSNWRVTGIVISRSDQCLRAQQISFDAFGQRTADANGMVDVVLASKIQRRLLPFAFRQQPAA